RHAECLKKTICVRQSNGACAELPVTRQAVPIRKRNSSCRKLQTDYLDLYLIHWPKNDAHDPAWLEKVQASWAAMEALYEQGKVRAIGLSNFLPHHIRPLLETARIRPMIDQLELHVGYMQEYALAYLRKQDILPQAWSPLGRARLLCDPDISQIAEKYGWSGEHPDAE
ncbi:MAG: aldo/keto reductase, partial [Oscillospiraceae bacterium]|nr:aldo/keto reductase [Oscillospiraceae bacterium]